MLKRLLVILLISLSAKSFAQTDSIFWFAAPEIVQTTNDHTDRPIIIHITAYSNPAVVTISQPANSNFSTITFSVPANSSVSYDLTSQIDKIESKPYNLPINTGLLIKSTTLITAYYEESSKNNPEMFVLKGNNALGTNFFIPAQNIMDNWDFNTSNSPYSSFDIVATEDNTVVTITPANDIQGHLAGISFQITLNKGQVYSAAAKGRLAANHLMGSFVSSNKKIAITIKDDSIGGAGYSGCLDLAGDQIVPTDLVGTKYITLPGFLNDPIGKPTDHLFLLATEDNTSITINGVIRTVINKGQTYHDSSMNEVKYIVTSLPTYALHLSGFGCEVGHAMLPQIECTGSQKVAFARSNATNLYMNILVPAGYEGDFKFNGNTSIITANLFDTVPFSNGLWKYARIPLTTTQLAVGNAAIVENSGIEFHLSIIHGDGSGARYGYFSDFNKLSVTASSNAVNGAICANSDLKFFTDYNDALGVSFSWVFNSNVISNLANPILPNISTSASGVYSLTATKFSCNAININIPIQVNPIPKPNLTTNAPICSNNALNLNAGYSGASFNWTGPNNFSSTSGSNTINNITVLATGVYKVTTSANNCSSFDSIAIVVNITPISNINFNSNNICQFKDIQLVNNNIASNVSYNWQLPNGSNLSSQNINIPSATLADAGKYFLIASTNTCNAKDSVTITVNAIPKPILTSNTPLCSGNDLTIDANYAGASFNWTGPNNFSSINNAIVISNVTSLASGYYKVVSTANNCSSLDSIFVTVNQTPIASIITNNNNPCLLEQVTLQKSSINTNANYNWILPNGTISPAPIINNINYSDTGKYVLIASIGLCSAKDSVQITVRSIPKIQFTALSEVCSNVAPFNLLATENTGIAGNGGVFSGFGVSTTGLFNPAIIGDGLATVRFTYSANNGCVAFKEQTIRVNPTPVISMDNEKAIKLGGSVQLDAVITGNFNSFVWQDATNTLSSKSILNPIASPIKQTTYRITVTTNKSCSVTDTVIVRIAVSLLIPNAFSPNNDGKNDKWEVEDKAQLMYLKANIFDRYGKLVKTLFGNKIVWDGMYNGQPLPIATYYYVLTITEGNLSKDVGGWIQLLR